MDVFVRLYPGEHDRLDDRTDVRYVVDSIARVCELVVGDGGIFASTNLDTHIEVRGVAFPIGALRAQLADLSEENTLGMQLAFKMAQMISQLLFPEWVELIDIHVEFRGVLTDSPSRFDDNAAIRFQRRRRSRKLGALSGPGTQWLEDEKDFI